jgi:hypothetical protein
VLSKFQQRDIAVTNHEHQRSLSAIFVRVLIFLLSTLSIGSLFSYFLGYRPFAQVASLLLLVEIAGLFAINLWMRKRQRVELQSRLFSGLWAGSLATLAYDLIRVPVALSGIPVFKAISYFGTAFLSIESPSPLSETLGWTYHLTNGVSFGLMYAALVQKPRVYSAVIWGLMLEAAMLLTPYAEVFGYRRDAKFLAITIGAHAVYGLVMYLALRLWDGAWGFRLTPLRVASGFLCVPVGLLLIAADFNLRYAASLPPSPPPYIGPHLYTTWNVPEPDRVLAMWVTRRFVEPQARFYFIQPFDAIKYGQPFDLPEARIRRQGMQSATQFILDQQGLQADPKLNALARMTYLNEVTPWMLATDTEAGQLTQTIRAAAEKECGKTLNMNCTERLFETLDRIYQEP